MIGAFSFMDGDRTFSCSIEGRGGRDANRWWWFGVTGDAHRYAPFLAFDGDTEISVRYRVVSYYDDLVARRERPFTSHRR